MNRRIWIASLLLLLTIWTGSLSTALGEGLLSLVPEKAYGFLIINRLEQSSAKLEKFAQQLEMPIPSPLLFLEQAGIKEGFDLTGNAMFVAMPGLSREEALEASDPLSGMFPMAFLPVKDYMGFVRQFGAQDPKEEIIEVPIAGAPVLIAHRGNYAVLVEPEHKAALAELLKSKGAAIPELASLEEWTAKQDFAAGYTPFASKLFTDKLLAELRQTQQRFKQLFQDADKGQEAMMKQLQASFKLYEEMMQGIQDEIPATMIGVRMNEQQDVFLAGQVLFQPNGNLAKWHAAAQSKDINPLEGLPVGPYVVASGMTISPELGNVLSSWTLRMLKMSVISTGANAADEESIAALGKTTEALLKETRSMSILVEPGEGEDPLYRNVMAIIKTNDAAKYMENYATMLDKMPRPNKDQPSQCSIERRKVAGQPGLVITMDYLAGIEEQMRPFVEEIYSKMFGEGGKMTIYLTMVDKQTLLMSYASEKRLAELAKHYQSAPQAFAKQSEVQAVTNILPGEWDVLTFVSPEGIVKMAQRGMKMFENRPDRESIDVPDFPATPPVFAAARTNKLGLEVEVVAPAETFTATFKYIQDLIAANEE